MQLTFIRASVPLCKSFSGTEVVPYPLIKEVSSYVHTATSLTEFKEHIETAARKGHALFRGSLTKELINESRAGHCDKDKKTSWLLLDIDHGKFKDHDEVIQVLPPEFHGVSYIVHYSSSYKVTKQHFAGHLYFLLDESRSHDEIKDYIKALNLDYFEEHLSLNSINTALLWPVDPSVSEASRLIYIAPPKCDKPLTFERTLLIEKAAEQLHIEPVKTQKARITRLVNKLRAEKGLPKNKKITGGVLPEVKDAEITGLKEERGYVYFNLNGGDSWAYYHPVNDPRFIYNFKGEPTYRTSELLPNYWRDIRGEEPELLTIRDIISDQYYNGYYFPDTDRHELYTASSKAKLNDFLLNHGEIKLESIPEWTVTFDFGSDMVIDKERKHINVYQRSDYMRRAQLAPGLECPPTIRKVIHSVVGSSQPEYDHFMNWIAGLVQKRRMLRTAWIFNGIQGTGKGVLFHRVLSPILGKQYTAARTLEGLEDTFNGYMENCCLLFIDEFRVFDSKKSQIILANLKNMIVEPYIAVRHMRQSARMVKNYINVIIGSNHQDTTYLPDSDRRFNVGKYQSKKIVLDADDIERIERELQQFTNYLLSYAVDEEKLSIPLENEARDRLKQLTGSSNDVIANKIVEGDFDFFLDLLPLNTKALHPRAQSFRDVLIYIYQNMNECRLSRDQLRDMFEYAVGNTPQTPTKFSQFLHYKGVYLKPIRIGNRVTKGIEVTFQTTQNKTEVEEILGHDFQLRRVK